MTPFRLRPFVALALCTGLAGIAGVSSASAARPVCNLITDPKGDATGPTMANNDPVLDIVSGDIATGSKNITAVVRVLKLAATSANYPYGISWRMNFTVGDTQYFLSAISDRSGLVAKSGYTDPTSGSGNIAGAATAVLDMAANEVRITSSTTAFAGRTTFKKGTVFTSLNSSTGGVFQAPDGIVNVTYPQVDTATGSSDYTGAAASCVKVK